MSEITANTQAADVPDGTTADSGAREFEAPAIPMSVVVLAKNEERNIARCVQAVSGVAEIVVVDDGSSDRTVELARSYGARVVQNQFTSFAAQRNWAMHNAELKYDWVLHLDADEVATPELLGQMRLVVEASDRQTVAYRMCRKTMLLDKWLKYSDGFPVWIMRLVRNGAAQFEDCGHGEVAVPEVSGEMGTLREPFLHYAFSKGMTDWIDRHNRYSTREAELELQQFQRAAVEELLQP